MSDLPRPKADAGYSTGSVSEAAPMPDDDSMPAWQIAQHDAGLLGRHFQPQTVPCCITIIMQAKFVGSPGHDVPLRIGRTASDRSSTTS